MLKKRLMALFLILSVLLSLAATAYADGVDQTDLLLSESSVLMKKGEILSLTAYSGTTPASDVLWSSSNPAAVRVDAYGTVVAQNWGQAVITAKSPSGATAACTVNAAIKGIDVSQHRGSIDWAQVKNSGVEFAIIRTGYGSENWSQQTDTYFAANYSGATASGIKTGAYHYSYATSVAMAKQEAAMCLHILNGRHLDYPVVYDVEDKSQYKLSTAALGEIIQAFCSTIQAAGYKTAVYSYVNFYNAHMTSPLVSQYDTWIANTGVSRPNFSRPYTMWQYGTKTVPGVSGACDVDYSYFDYAGTSGSTPEPPKPTDRSVFKSSTTGTYTFGANRDYFYRITTADGVVPNVRSSNPQAVQVSYVKQVSDGFLFRITNLGKGGQSTITTTSRVTGASVSFNAVTAYQPPVSYVSDTPSAISLKKGQAYQFAVQVASSSSDVSFCTGNNSVIQSVTYAKSGDKWLYQITASGSGTAGVYVRVGSQTPVRICTVTVQ